MAINRSELRIGSQIQHGRILELYQDHALVECMNGSRPQMKYKDMEPLPLTTGYLLIAGFERLGAAWHRPGMMLLEEDRGFFMRLGANEYVTRDPILSVHRLQNLYHDVTGQILPSNIDERDTITDQN